VPRRARKFSKTGIYHVMHRGIGRAIIFHDGEDLINVVRGAVFSVRAAAPPGCSAGSGKPDQGNHILSLHWV
jgi:hypothetical protein